MTTTNAEDLPRYRIPLHRLAQAAWYMALNKPRNLGQDFHYLESNVPVQPKLEGAEMLNVGGPLVLVANHYERPGLWMGWSGLIIAHKVYETTGRRVRFIAISEWNDFRLAGLPIPPKVTRFAFERFYRTFGFIPMEPEGAGAVARSMGVRAALRAVSGGEVICIFPEGDVGPTPAMIAAQGGVGAFVLRLASRGAKVVPVGLFEKQGILHVSVAPSVNVDGLMQIPKEERDIVAGWRIMVSVAKLLPPELRGYYSDLSRYEDEQF